MSTAVASPITAPVATKRLNINLTDAAAEELEQLSEEFGLTKTALVRTALGVLRLLLQERKLGHRFAVMDEGGKILKEIVLPF